MVEGICVYAAGFVDDGFADLVEVAGGVCGCVDGGRVRFFVYDGVFVAVDCGVETCWWVGG